MLPRGLSPRVPSVPTPPARLSTTATRFLPVPVPALHAARPSGHLSAPSDVMPSPLPCLVSWLFLFFFFFWPLSLYFPLLVQLLLCSVLIASLRYLSGSLFFFSRSARAISNHRCFRGFNHHLSTMGSQVPSPCLSSELDSYIPPTLPYLHVDRFNTP